MMKSNKIIGYVRVSTAKQNYGLESQQQAIEHYAIENNLEIISIYVEKESGKNNNRTELNKAIADTKLNNACLVVAKLDRLSRNVSFIFTLRDAKINFVALDLREFNTMSLAIFASVAQHERELISSRTKEGLKIAKQKGKKLGNPTGFNALARINSVKRKKETAMSNNLEAKNVIKVLYVDDKLSLRAIANKLNAMQIKTVNGKIFSASSVARIIKMHEFIKEGEKK
jgi:DNA invertase Pin-like site-specific DNA recombinase